MADDINSYALNLAFSIQTAPAITGLGGVLNAIVNIQKGLQDVAQTLSDKVTKTLASVQKQVEAIATSNEQIAKTTTKFSTDFTKTSKTITTASKDYHKITLELEKQVKQYKLLNQAIKTQGIDTGDFLDQWQEQADIGEQISSTWNRIKGSGKEMVGQGKEQAGVGNRVAAAWVTVYNALGKTADQGKEHVGIGGRIAAAFISAKDAVIDTVLSFASMLIGIQGLKAGFAAFLEEENKFNTLNYRIYGTQNQILGQVSKTTSAYRLMWKEGIAGFSELGAIIRSNDNELTDFVTTNAMYSNALGVSQKDLAAWQRAMKGVGIDSKEQTVLLGKQADAMYKLGLSAQQMASLLGDQAKTAAALNIMWGKAGVAAISEIQANMMGLSNTMNLPMAQVDAMQKSLSEVYTNQDAANYYKSIGKLSEEAAARIRNDISLSKEQRRAAMDLARQNDGLNRQMQSLADLYKRTGGQGDEYNYTLLAMEGYTHMSRDALDGYARTQMQLNATLKAGEAPFNMITATTDQLTKAMKGLEDATTKDMTAEEKRSYYYEKSTATVAKSFGKMWANVQGAWMDAFNALKPAMMFFLDNVLTPIVDGVAWFIRLLAGALPPAKQAAGAIDGINKAAQPTVTTLGWMGDKLSLLWSYLGPVAKGAVLLSAGLVAIFAAFAGAAAAIMMWNWFMSVTNAPKLFAIAVAAFAVGASVLAIAFAIKMLADLDYGKLWSAVGALAVVFGILALAVLGMSTGVGGAAAIALAGVLLGISVAAMIAAGAAYVLALAFETAANSIVKLMEVPASDLLIMGGALIIFGGELLAAAVTIGAGGAAMAVASIALGLGMGGLSVAMLLISNNAIAKMERLGDGGLANFGRALVIASPGIATFIASMGLGIVFAKGMGGLASGLSYLAAIDAAALLTTSAALLVFGRAIKIVSGSVTNLASVSDGISSFGSAISGVVDGLASSIDSIANAVLIGGYKMMFGSILFRSSISPLATAVDGLNTTAKAASSLTPSITGLVDAVSQLQSSDIIGAFTDLLSSVPVISSITDTIAAVIQAGQEKIRAQIDELKTSFSALELIAAKLDLPIGSSETATKKKVMAETVSTIQVKTETSGGVSTRWQQQEAQAKQVELMGIIADAVNKLSKGNVEDVGVIRGLLEEHLPKLGESPSKLGTRLNSWT